MFETLTGLLMATAVSGVLPLVNAEAVVVVAAAALPAVGLPLVALVSTAGQMLTKTGLFALARWAPHHLPAGAQDALGRAGERLDRKGGAAGSMVFLSAATGLPPFYGVSLACGALGMRTVRFVTAGSLGRFLRFGILAWTARQVGPGALESMSGFLGVLGVGGGS